MTGFTKYNLKLDKIFQTSINNFIIKKYLRSKLSAMKIYREKVLCEVDGKISEVGVHKILARL